MDDPGTKYRRWFPHFGGATIGHMVLTLTRRLLISAGALVIIGLTGSILPVHALNYGSGTYGTCQYNSCGISVTSSGSVTLDVAPSAGTKCTVASDTVSVLTDSSTGYTLQINDNDTDNRLNGAVHGSNISASSGSAGTPATLAGNSWGYRVDATSGFGAGPTNSQSSGSVPSLTFAAVPVSSGSPDTIASSSSAADPAVNTQVWYGVCVDTSLVSDSYTDSLVYTALVN